MDTEAFDVEFPTSWERNGEVEKAKATCARCPVRRECLAWAFEIEEHRSIRHYEAAGLGRGQYCGSAARLSKRV